MLGSQYLRWMPPGLSLLPPLLALVLQWSCWSMLQPLVWFLFYPAVFFSSWIGGKRGGLWATALSIVAVWFVFIPATTSSGITIHHHVLSVAVFLLMGVLFSVFHERLRLANHQTKVALDALQAGHVQLEARVRERTAELELNREGIQRSEARVAGLVDSAMDAIISVDGNQIITLFNKAAEATFGCAASEALGQPLEKFIPSRFREGHAHHVKAFGQTGSTSRTMHSLGHLKALRNTGEEFPIEASISQIDVDGEKTYTVILRDITTRKRAEDALRKTKERLRIVTENARLGLVMVSRERRYLYANSFYAEIAGLPVVEIEDQFVEDVLAKIPPAFVAIYNHHIRPRLDQAFDGKEVLVELERPTPGGNRHFTLKYEPIIEDDEVAMVVGVVTDITEHKRAEEYRRSSEERMRIVTENANLGLVVFDRDRRFLYANSFYAKVIGLPLPEIVDQLVTDVMTRVHPAVASVYYEQLRPQLDRAFAGEHLTLEIVPPHVREMRHLSITYEPMIENGEVSLVVAVIADLTERKRAEEALRESEEQRYAADRRIADIVHGMTEACFAVDADWRFTFVNDRGEMLFRHSRQEILGRSIWDVFHKLVGTPMETHYRRAMAERVPVAFEAFSPIAERWLDVRLFPTADGLAAFLLDIDTRKQAEETLRIKQEHSKSLLRLARNLERATTLADIMTAAREEVKAILGLNALWFYQTTKDKRSLRLIMADTQTDQVTQPEAGELLLIEGDPMLEEIVAAEDLVIVEDARTDPRTNKQLVAKMGGLTVINMPVAMAGGKIGAIGSGTFGNEGVRTFTPTEQRYFASLANHVGVVIDRVQALDKRDEAEAAQRSAAEMQTTILNALPAQIALIDEESTIVAVNENWCRVSGSNDLASGGLDIGRNYIEICESAAGSQSEDATLVASGIREVLDGRQPEFSIEYPCHSPTEERWFRLMVTPLQPGRKAGAVVMHVDVTERIKAEATVRESEERFRQLAEHIQEVFWIVSVATREMLYVSPAYEDIWGRTCESLYAEPQTWMDAIHPDDRASVLQARNNKQTQGIYDEEYRIFRPDGSIRWIRDRAFPVRDASGKIYRMVGVAKDISERKRIRDLLQEQASLLNKARDAILVRDLNHGITFWNKSAEQLYGWTAEEALGRQASNLIHRDKKAYHDATDAVIARGEWSGELQQFTKSGAPVLIEARWTLVRDAQGLPKSILAINTDITEKKNIEQQFLRAQRMESIGTLAGGIAHDLNNVLAPIMMSIDLLKITTGDERSQGILTTIQSSARRGADMVQQILSFARGVEGDRAPINPRLVIKEIQHLVQDTFPKDIKFEADLTDDLPMFRGDHTQVHQVLLNLCVNARDAMPHGGRLAISAGSIAVDEHYSAMNPGAAPGSYVVIKVTDTGTGMPKAVVDKIFDPFFTTKEVGKGTGLGLSTVLAIVKSHGGFLHVYSEPGEGTTFAIYFPAHQAPDLAVADATTETHPRGNGELILVVDDEAALRTIAQQTLETYGYRVLVAANGTEAIALYAKNKGKVAVVVTDMMMPEMDGPSTIQVLRHIEPKIKIIAASGLASEAGTVRATSMGVKHVLLKPYTARAVLTALQEILADRDGELPVATTCHLPVPAAS